LSLLLSATQVNVARIAGLYVKNFPILAGIFLSFAVVPLNARLAPALGRPNPTIMFDGAGAY
jgi:hypothetical protein